MIQDGGSTDCSRAVIERFGPRLQSLGVGAGRRSAAALNRGFEETSGEVMGWLNADDMLLPGSLAYVASFLRRNPSVDVVYGHRILIDEDGREIGRQVIPRHDDGVLEWADFLPPGDHLLATLRLGCGRGPLRREL